eukprot:Awhi_evm1s13912
MEWTRASVLFKSHIAHCNGMEKTKKVELQNEYFDMILDRDHDNSDRNPNKYFVNSDIDSSSSREDDSGDDSDDSDIDDKNTGNNQVRYDFEIYAGLVVEDGATKEEPQKTYEQNIQA